MDNFHTLILIQNDNAYSGQFLPFSLNVPLSLLPTVLQNGGVRSLTNTASLAAG